LGVIIDRSPHQARLSRHGRGIARRMLRLGLVRQHASVLHAQSAALGHEVGRLDGRQRALPGESQVSPGLKVRVGPENRALLRRLLAARNLREIQALAREIRHRITKAIERAERLQRLRERARKARSRAGQWVTGHVRSGWEKAVPQRGKPDRARPDRKPATRARKTAAVPSRGRFSTPDRHRGRFERPARKRTRRGRPAWTRVR